MNEVMMEERERIKLRWKEKNNIIMKEGEKNWIKEEKEKGVRLGRGKN